MNQNRIEELQASEALLHRLLEAAGCPDEDNGDRIVARVKGLYDAVIGTHRAVTPAEGGPDMCGDCGADIEDAIDEAVLCPAHGRREAADELIDLRSKVDALESPKHWATLTPWREPPTHQHGVPFRCGHCGHEIVDGHMCVRIQTPTGSYAKVLDDDRG